MNKWDFTENYCPTAYIIYPLKIKLETMAKINQTLTYEENY